MKKLLIVTLAVVFALVITGCGDDGGESQTVTTTLRVRNESGLELNDVTWNNTLFLGKENADIIGTWTGALSSGGGNITMNTAYNVSLVINESNFSMTATHYLGGLGAPTPQYEYDSGTWTRSGNTINLKSNITLYGFNQNGSASIAGNDLNFNREYINFVKMGSYKLTSDNLDKSLKPGNNVLKNVENGSGYIRFNYNGNSYRTSNLLVVEKGDIAEFIFTNNTVVVGDNGNSVMLGSL